MTSDMESVLAQKICTQLIIFNSAVITAESLYRKVYTGQLLPLKLQ